MNRWKHRVALGDVFHNDDMPLPEKGGVIAQRIKAASFYSDEDYDLVNMIEELEDAARDDDEHYFDLVWSAFYDWADANRVWVETFAR